jgi:amino acid adenylation domain-containing protein
MSMPIVQAAASERRSLDGFFSASLRKFPDRPALFASGQLWSYNQLHAECGSIVRALHAAGSTGRQCNVGLIYGRSMFSYAAIIAIMRAGEVYVPLNAKLPAERLLKIIEDAGIEVVIIDAEEVLPESVINALRRIKALHILVKGNPSSSSLEATLRDSPQHRVWRVSAAENLSEYPEASSSDTAPGSGRIAYIIYTSGSTGVPKGVAITQESACRCIEKSHCIFGTSEEDRFTQFSALSFDVSILDLFLCWKSGGALYVPAPAEALMPLSFVVTHAITVWSSVPSLANFMLKLQLLKSDVLSKIRLSLFCGEALPSELALAWSTAAPASRIFNLYGPTEVTVFATYYEYERQSDLPHGVVPIGAPLPGVECMIVADDTAVVADDLPGELWLAGDQLALGYWNNPATTAAAFVRARFAGVCAEVWYRTGDLVSRRRGVGLSFRGRLDRQVKLRGHRIELQEIESTLRDLVGCAQVAIVPLRTAGGICEKIIAYCDKLNADETTVKARCLNRMTHYMVPERILELDTFPLTANGKVDYLALAARSTARPEQAPPARGT